jgi:1-acyl-sn-glycerol-3-phosphate acyltransferase
MFVLHPKHPIIFVGKKELEKYPIFGRTYKKVSILVDRSDKKSREAVFPAIKKKLTKENKNVVLFPEGGVPDRDIILEKFKDGAFISAIYCNTPVVVYAFHNLKNMFPFVSTIGQPGKIKVERLSVLYPEGETKDSLREKVYTMIYDKIKNDKLKYPEIK